MFPRARVLAGLLALAMVGASLGASAAPPAPKEIVIGAALPLTGTFAREGGYFKDGYEMAVKEINERGGIFVKEYGKRIPVRLILYDDKSDATTSVSLYEKLVTEDKVHALLGGYSTPLIQAHTVVPEKYKVPYVNGGGASTAIYARGYKWIFGLLASIEKLAITLMNWIASQQDAGKLGKPLRIAIAWENTSHGKDFQKGILDKARASPDRFVIVFDEPFEIGSKDFTPLLQKVKAANADAWLVDARIADAILMQRQLTELGLYFQVISYGPRGTEKAIRDALGPAADYIVSVNWWHRDLPYPQARAFVRKYEETYKKPAEWFPALAYETARVLFKAIEQAGSLNKAKIRDALAKMDMRGSIVVGQRVWFGPNGQIDNDYVIMQNLPGRGPVLVYPKYVALGEAVVPIPRR